MPWQLHRLDSPTPFWSLTPGVDLDLVPDAEPPLQPAAPSTSDQAEPTPAARITWEGDQPLLGPVPGAPAPRLNDVLVTEPMRLWPRAVITCAGLRLGVQWRAFLPAASPAMAPVERIGPGPPPTSIPAVAAISPPAEAVPLTAPSVAPPAAEMLTPPRPETILAANALPGPVRRRARWPLFAGLATGLSLLLCVAIVATAGLGTNRFRGDSGTGSLSRPLPRDGAALQRLRETVAPRIDYYRWYDEVAAACGTHTPRLTRMTRLDPAPGDRQTFRIGGQQRPATLSYRNDSAYVYVEDGLFVEQARTRQLADDFQSRIYPEMRRIFGEEWPTEQDDDKHVTILVAHLFGASGAFSQANLVSRAISPNSAERRIIYVDADIFDERPDYARGTLAHELQHLINFRMHSNSDAWVDEGAAELAAMLVGGDDLSDRVPQFMQQSDIQLNSWENVEPTRGKDRTLAHYAAGALFIAYFMERHGGPDLLKELLAAPGNGEQQYAAWLARHAPNETFDGVFADWMVANLINERAVGDGRYAYQTVRDRHALDKTLSGPGDDQGDLPHYAAHYVELRPGQPGAYELRFQGDGRARLLPTQPPGPGIWWANSGDEVHTKLTRTLDLTGLKKATLRSTLWYSLNRGTQATIEVSTDGGCTWKTLRGQNTRGDYLSLGPLQIASPERGYSYQGQSGQQDFYDFLGRDADPVDGQAHWIEETTDLSPYAGKAIQLRYTYASTNYVSTSGFALGRMAVPEIGFVDDLQTSNGWQAEGFVHLPNDLPETWRVRLVKYGRSGPPTVEDVPLAADQTGTVTIPDLGGQTTRAVLVFAATTPQTVTPAHYQLSLSRK